MSNKNYTDKYLKLLEKLTNFLTSNGAEAKKLPKNASYVAFSAKDKDMNKINIKILSHLKKENKPIVKAEEPSSLKGSWKFTVVTY